MAEYINREEIMKFPIRRNHCDNEHGDIRFLNGIEVVMEYIEEIPSADVQPVKHGHWIKEQRWNDYSCSCCSGEYIGHGAVIWKYCPNCGAKMNNE